MVQVHPLSKTNKLSFCKHLPLELEDILNTQNDK